MYEKMLKTRQPGCLVILIDRSWSMTSPFGGPGSRRKMDECALAVNRLLREISLASAGKSGVHARCFVGLIGYGESECPARSAFGGTLAGQTLVPISTIADHPLRVEMVTESRKGPSGTVIDVEVPLPVWIEPAAESGTPMAKAFDLAAEWIAEWVEAHPTSFPPVVINVTDGEPDSFDATRLAANNVRQLATEDGATLVFNAHISGIARAPVVLPAASADLPLGVDGTVDKCAQFLFDISSVVPEVLLTHATAADLTASQGARAMVFNADATTLARLLVFGSGPMR